MAGALVQISTHLADRSEVGIAKYCLTIGTEGLHQNAVGLQLPNNHCCQLLSVKRLEQ